MSNSQDETLITPSSKRKFGKDATDWMFLFPDVPKRLMKIFQEGYFIVVFTNQLGIGLDSTGKRQAEFKRKVRDIFDQVLLYMTAARIIFRLKFQFYLWRPSAKMYIASPV
jgi:DNA 3'-phosphatase